MNVVFSCRVCTESLVEDEQVIGMSREVPVENTGIIDLVTRPEDGYVHPRHERAAASLGYRRLRTGTLMELEAQRNPNLYK